MTQFTFINEQKINLPAWANWIAQDQDGCWWAYEVEPLQHDTGWYENEVGKIKRLHKGHLDKPWQSTLIRLES